MQDTPEGPFRSLVVLGESTVEGGAWLSRVEDRWPDLLWHLLEKAQEAPVRYHNAGVGASVISPRSSGYEASTKPSASERLESEVIDRDPDLVVISYGLNDMRAGMEPDEFEIELNAIIDRLRGSVDAMIVLANVYYISDYGFYPPFDRGSREATEQYNQAIRDLAARQECVYADAWSAEGQKDYVIHQDTVHANKIGNMLIAHRVFEAIVHAAPGVAAAVRRRDGRSPWTKRALRLQAKGVEESHGSIPGT